MKQGICDVYDLMSAHMKMHPDSHFFDSNTLKFFGETLSSMRLLKGTVKVTDSMDKEHNCYVLSTLQKNCPTGSYRIHHYFDIDTLEHVVR